MRTLETVWCADEVETVVVHNHKLDDRPRELLGLGLLLVEHGEVDLREREVARLRLLPADVALLSPGARAELSARADTAELVEFHAGSAWLEDALARGRCAWPRDGEAVSVGRAGSELASRAGRALRELLRLVARPEPVARLREASVHLELLACALEGRQVPAPWIAPRRASSRRRSGFLSAVADLASGRLEDLSLERCSERLGLSPRQTSRLFREELGLAFRDWISAKRLARACQLLQETDLPVIDVAVESGWGSLAHFNATFRRRKGCTPSDYRQSLRGIPTAARRPVPARLPISRERSGP